jgi:sterol desaturase/sphingolipid hydroxylase (fatty acid hydroxylase superfamily)
MLSSVFRHRIAFFLPFSEISSDVAHNSLRDRLRLNRNWVWLGVVLSGILLVAGVFWSQALNSELEHPRAVWWAQPFKASIRNLVLSGRGENFWWVNLAVSALVAAAIYWWRSSTDTRPTLSGCLRFLAPRSILFHRSALADYKFYISNGFVEPLLAVLLVTLTSAPISAYAASGFTLVFGPGDGASPSLVERAIYTVLLVCAIDLGYFVFHFLSHKSALLWEFHKVHHAAEILTPATAYRNHPVDVIVRDVMISIPVGLVNGIFGYTYDGPVRAITILNVSCVVFIYNLTANLRHSHVWLGYGWNTSHILSSPAQHHIHHSCEARHIDTNFGLMLSVWDWLAGTLYIPKERERFRMGLEGGQSEDYLTLWGCYITPFFKATALMRSRLRKLPRIASSNRPVPVPAVSAGEKRLNNTAGDVPSAVESRRRLGDILRDVLR